MINISDFLEMCPRDAYFLKYPIYFLHLISS